MSTQIPKKLLPWIEAKKKHRLSQKHIQMARELGLNPKGFGKLDNHKQERWKAPLPQFIEDLYYKRFNKEAPDQVYSFEQLSLMKNKKKTEKKTKKALNLNPKPTSNPVNISEMEQDNPTVLKLICDDPWFAHIRNGLKPVEGRKNTPKYQKIHMGCFIEFSNGKENFLASVVEIRSYPTLEAYLNDVTFQMALPGISSFEEAVKVYYQWSTPDEIEKHGFLGIFVKPITQ